jgi:gluconolactonase
MVEFRVVANGLRFPEGPVAMRDGSVLVAEIAGGAIQRVKPDGTVHLVAHTGGGPNGMAFGPDDALYICNNGGNEYRAGTFLAQGPAKDYAGGSIQKVNVATGLCETLYTHCDGHRLSSPNDIVFDTDGGFYFTDIGKRRVRDRDDGGIYYALTDGSKIVEVAYNVAAANGIGLSPNERTVYVAETETSRLWAFDIVAPGVVTKLPFPSPHGGRLICGLPGFQRFDSLAVQANGHVCVGTLNTGHITIVPPDGDAPVQIKVPDIYPTNICFGGPDMKTAYITLSGVGQLVSADWPDAGLPLNHAQ